MNFNLPSILDYDIDGLVIKQDRISEDEWEHPKTQIAWKFPNQYKSTILRDVIWQYKGNRITPVGIFDAINLGGATVTKATLNNIELIEEMGLKIGAKIEVCRANEVIPKIQSVLEPGAIDITPPTICPICNAEIIREGKFFYCSNQECDSKQTRKIMDWLTAHSSKGIAQETVDLLYENGCFDSLYTFLQIPERPLLIDFISNNLEGFGERKCEILINEINKTKNTTILKFMDGLGFKDMGKKKWQSILEFLINDKYTNKISIISFLNYIGISNNCIVIPGIAEETNRKIKESYEKNKDSIDDLLRIVKVEDYKIQKEESYMKLNGKSFCFTGALETMKRAEAQALVEKAGGTNKSGVSAGLDYLVTNELSDSVKSKKAIELGITVINEEDFLGMINL